MPCSRKSGNSDPLRDKPEETPERLLCALWAHRRRRAGFGALGDPRWPAAARRLRGIRTLRELLARKKSGVPLAHLTQRQTFLVSSSSPVPMP